MEKLLLILVLLMIGSPIFGMSESELIKKLKTNAKELMRIIEQQETELKVLRSEVNMLHNDLEQLKKSYEKQISSLTRSKRLMQRENELLEMKAESLTIKLRRRNVLMTFSLIGNIVQAGANIGLGIKLSTY